MSGIPDACPVCGSPKASAWTDTPPAQPGWYAVKHIYRDRYLKEDISYVDVVQVAEGRNSPTVTGRGKLLWFGPLAFPE